MLILECIDDKNSNNLLKKGNLYIPYEETIPYYHIDPQYKGRQNSIFNGVGGYFKVRFKVIKNLSCHNKLVRLCGIN